MQVENQSHSLVNKLVSLGVLSRTGKQNNDAYIEFEAASVEFKFSLIYICWLRRSQMSHVAEDGCILE